jgi:UDP-N-acetylglucosamine--N-acetylmuramyl-(pentapeptide) pyrophosphoryl-undecaprenol N-acetylglucosamine transferase
LTNDRPKKLLLAGGGTGGHIFAAQAIAESFEENLKGEALFVGSRRGLEAKILPRKNLPYSLLLIGPLKGGGFFRKTLSLLQIPVAFLQAFWILLSFRPDAVIGVGGYAGGPVVLLARLLKRVLGIKKIAILEQNSIPGFTNLLLSKFSERIYLHFAETQAYFKFPERCVRVGNPLRSDLIDAFNKQENKVKEKPERKAQRLLIFGGSQGALGLNRLFLEVLRESERLKSKLHEGEIEIVHQSGPKLLEDVLQAYEKLNLDDCSNLKVIPFIDDMVVAYKSADLVIARAGASTLSELTLCGVPAIVVPLPSAADDHQKKNAQVLERKGALRIWPQKEIKAKKAGEELEALLQNKEELMRMSSAMKALGEPQAAQKIVEDLFT